MSLHRLAGLMPRSAFRLAYRWATELSRLAGRRSRVVVVAVWHAEQLLVVRHWYWSGLTLPGGHVADGEQLHAAAARELYEEVGFAVPPASLRLRGRIEQRHTHLHLLECELTHRPRVVIDDREITAAAFAHPSMIHSPSVALRCYLRAHRRTATRPTRILKGRQTLPD